MRKIAWVVNIENIRFFKQSVLHYQKRQVRVHIESLDNFCFFFFVIYLF